jgi:hypothetical protein
MTSFFGPHHFVVTRSLLGERSESVVSSYAECSSKEALKRTSRANFHEKALFVKADVADPFMRERDSCVSFAMLPSALLVSPLLGDSVHCEIHLFGLPRRRCNLRIGLSSS